MIDRIPWGGIFTMRTRRGLVVGPSYAGLRTVDEAEFHNLIPDAAANAFLAGTTTPATAMYIDLIAASPSIVAGDTAASHAGWTFFAGYVAASRPAWTTVLAGRTRGNAASPASFTANVTNAAAIGGASVHTDSTKGGTTGLLWSAGARGATLGVTSGDIVTVEYDLTA